MRKPEPIKPAEPKQPWNLNRWFCVECGSSFDTESGVRIHVKNAHLGGEDESEKAVHYAQGWQIEQMLERWDLWRRAELLRAERFFASIVGPDDFLLECENDR